MAVSRVVTSQRWCRRHVPYFAIGVAILSVQIVLGYLFYLAPASESHAGHLPTARTAGSRASDSQASNGREQSAQSDDEYNDEDGGQHPRSESQRSPLASNYVNGSEGINWAQLGFRPECDIVEKDALSAIRRATTTRCKQELANVTCLVRRGLLYPSELPRFCKTSPGRVVGAHLGCFRDDRKSRIFERLASRTRSNSRRHCVGLCLRLGFAWAGLQYGTECFCSKERPAANLTLPSRYCDMVCPADDGELCGGYLAMDVFSTGLPSVGEVTKREILWPLAPTTAKTLKPARVAFLLCVNGRAVRQVLRLLQFLYHERHVFYIHVDARQDHLYRSLLPLESRYSNVYLARDRLATIWGGSSLLEMLLRGMAYLLRRHPGWDYFVNLSETDYPVKSREELEMFLAANMGSNFVKSHGQDTQRFIGKQALERTFHECGGRMWRLGPRTLPWGLRLDGGSDWVALHRDFCSYVALPEHEDPLLQGLKALFRHTLLPAESFFHTALQNSIFCGTVADQNLRLVNWKRRQGCQCQHRHVVDWCGCSPNVFRTDDWPRIQATRDRPVFFARKFESSVSRKVLDQVDVWIAESRPHLSSAGPAVPPAGYWQNEFDSGDGVAADDVKLTVYESLARLADRHLGSFCVIGRNRSLSISSVHLYFFGDQFQGLLMSYTTGGDSYEAHLALLERWQPGNQDTAAAPALARLRFISVGTEYDPKEQLIRDLARILGPESSPGILHSWGSGPAIAVTIVWVDPAKVVAGSYEVQVEVGPQTLFHRPEFRKPLRPGTWTVMLFHHWSLVAQMRFLVSPVAYHDKIKLTSATTASRVNGGPHGPYIGHDLSRVEEHLGYSAEARRTLQAQADDDAFLIGADLDRWVDALTAQFWTFRVACVARHVSSSSVCESLTPCRECAWSSHWPDPTIQVVTGT
ncbi:xylosyltransferase oxt-like isoform X1 [Rhipicephalus microplus]|uniref:xylosyltransferase oxt-like isoform X1 n=1 Tax=Rhipicephalus microplus TaxID=6941 RepID=UPI003F6C98B6